MAEWDLFISYARNDNHDGWVQHFVTALQEEHARFTPTPLRVFLDLDEIRTAQDWELRIREGLRGTHLLLAMLSPAYFASEWCRREWEEFLEVSRERFLAGERVAPVYIVEAPGFLGGETSDDWLADLRRRQACDVRLWRDGGPQALRREDVRQRLQRLDQDLSRVLERAERAAGSPTTIPPHNPRFVGREAELRQLREMLALGQLGAITALHGIGGIGKSALAFEYAHAYADAYPGGRFLVPCAGVADPRLPIVNLADRLDVDLNEEDRRDLAAAYARVRTALETGEAKLLLLDNLDDAALLRPDRAAQWLPASETLHLLVTTRLEPDRLADVECLALDRLPPNDALRLLEKHRPCDAAAERDAAAQIAARLDGHPLALEAVAVYVWQHPEVTYAGYLQRLAAEGLEAVHGAGMDDRVALSRHQERLLGHVLAPTLDNLSLAEGLALQYAALLPADAIAIPWLRELVGSLHPEMATPPAPGYPDPWEQLRRRLFGLRLLTAAEDGPQRPGDTAPPRRARMHRLVQEVVAQRLGEHRSSRQTELVELALRRARFLWDGWVDRASRWEIEPLLEFARQLLDQQDAVPGGHLACLLHEPLYRLSRLQEGEAILRRALELELAHYGPDASELASTYTNLGLLVRGLGRSAEAEPLLRRSVEILERAYGPDRPDLAVHFVNLAGVLRDLNQLQEGRELLRRAIESQRQEYGDDHPTLAVNYSNLALTEHALGNLHEAEQLLLRAVEIDQQAYAPNHPTLATRYSNLGIIEHDLGNYEEAERLTRKALAIAEAAFGPDSPTVGNLCSNLGLTLQCRGLQTESRDLLTRAIAITERAYPPTHPMLATQYSNLGATERLLGRHKEAERLTRRAIEIAEQAFGPNHSEVATHCHNLSAIREDQDDLDGAAALLERTLRIEEAVYSPFHRFLGSTCQRLGTVERKRGNLDRARQLLQRAIAISERASPPDFPALQLRLRELALVEDGLQQEDAAYRASQAALVAAEQSGDEAAIAECAVRLALREETRGDLDAAARLLRRALELEQRLRGADDVSLAGAWARLASLRRKQGDLAEAEALFRRTLAIEEAGYGPDHHEVAATCELLCQVLQESGRSDEAAQLMRRCIAIWEGELGRDDARLAPRYFTLAGLERQLGNLDEAERLLAQTEALEVAAYGPDAATLGSTYNDLGLVRRELGRAEEARETLLRAIAIDARSLAADHSEMAVRYINLALAEKDLGRFDEARRLLRQAIDSYEKTNTPPEQLSVAYGNLATVEEAAGELPLAIELMRQAYDLRVAGLGAEHPHCQAIRERLRSLQEEPE